MYVDEATAMKSADGGPPLESWSNDYHQIHQSSQLLLSKSPRKMATTRGDSLRQGGGGAPCAGANRAGCRAVPGTARFGADRAPVVGGWEAAGEVDGFPMVKWWFS